MRRFMWSAFFVRAAAVLGLEDLGEPKKKFAQTYSKISVEGRTKELERSKLEQKSFSSSKIA